MKNLTVQKEKVKKNKKEVTDKLGILDEVKFILDNSALQNKDVKGDLYFIRNEDLEELPNKIVEAINEKLGD